MAQLISITSEGLQATIRRLLPSQRGFGEDLQASNVITPIIDLTPTAEGSALPTSLAQAINFGGATEFEASNSVDSIVNTPGFYRIIGAASCRGSGGPYVATIRLNDATTNKFVWQLAGADTESTISESFDYIVYLIAGEALAATSNNAHAIIRGSVRQVADVYGNTINPTGFTFE